MTPIILIKVTQVYEGITVIEARASTEVEINPLVDSERGAYDFKGQTLRIVVLPIHCSITKERALELAKDYVRKPFQRLVDFAEYSQLQGTLQGALRRNQQYQRKRWKPTSRRDKHFHDVSSQDE